MNIKKNIYALSMPVVQLYWRIFKPQSYGVKIAIIHPNDPNKVLLVRHTYGNTDLWNIPGGGYNPKKETAESAAAREVLEEIGVHLLTVTYLGEYHTEHEGKRDTVSMFLGTIQTTKHIETSPELSQLDWVAIHTVSARGTDIARVARRAIEKVIDMYS